MKRVEFLIDENLDLAGVKTISLVDYPAVESNFKFFSKEKQDVKYVQHKGEEYKQVVAGLALIPDKTILRYDENNEPYEGFFSAETIEKIRNKFHKEGLTHSVNTDHNPDNYINAYLLESFIVDSEERLNDVKQKGIDEVKLGSWFVSYKIEDKETFENVVSGKLNGFSVEAYLQEQFNKQNNNLNKTISKAEMSILDKLKAVLQEFENAKVEVKLEVAKIEDGTEVSYSEIGEPVTFKDAESVEQPLADGEYKLDNEKTIVVKEGKLESIEDTKAAEEPAPAEEELSKDDKAVEAELSKIKEEFSKATNEVQKLKAEIEKLKKAPASNPTVVKPVKENKVDFSKLSNIERIALRNGITL